MSGLFVTCRYFFLVFVVEVLEETGTCKSQVFPELLKIIRNVTEQICTSGAILRLVTQQNEHLGHPLGKDSSLTLFTVSSVCHADKAE